MFVIEVSIK